MSSEEESIDSIDSSVIENSPVAKKRRKATATSANPNNGQDDAAIIPHDCYLGQLDEVMKQHIASYMDIYQWGFLTQCSKWLASSWPKPPPPNIDYDLISFHFCDDEEAWYGVSKSISAALEAYLYMKNQNNNNLRREAESTDYTDISIKFLKLGEAVPSQYEVPLLRFLERQQCGWTDPAEIHPDSEEYGGVKIAGENLSKMLTRMMDFTLDFMFDNEDMDENGNPEFKVEESCKAAWLWLKDAKPSRDINLNYLWTSRDYNYEEDDFDREYVYEIWHVKDQSSRHFWRGENGDWAVSIETSTLWDSY